MTTTTTPVGFPASARTEKAPAKSNFLTRFFERIIEARMRRAELQVQPHLAELSDERLKDLGFTGERIGELREKHYAQAVYWS